MSELGKVQEGEPFQPSAKWQRGTVDAIEHVRRLQASGIAIPTRDLWQGGIVQVKNGSGADRNRFDVLGIDDVFPTPTANLNAFKNGPEVQGITPTSGHRGKFVILLEPLKSGKIGPGCIAGTTVAKVTVANTSHQYADPKSGDAGSLQSCGTGSAHIIWRESGTGVKWAIVQLGNSQPEIKDIMGGRIALNGFSPANSIKYYPSTSNQVCLWNGSAWQLYEFDPDNPPTASIANIDASASMYLGLDGSDVALYAYEKNGPVWSDGILVRMGQSTGDKSKRYVGHVGITGTPPSGLAYDNLYRRGVVNYYNRKWKQLRRDIATDFGGDKDVSVATETGWGATLTCVGRWFIALNFQCTIRDLNPGGAPLLIELTETGSGGIVRVGGLRIVTTCADLSETNYPIGVHYAGVIPSPSSSNCVAYGIIFTNTASRSMLTVSGQSRKFWGAAFI